MTPERRPAGGVETAGTTEALQRFATVDIAARCPEVPHAVLASARTLAEEIGDDCEVVLPAASPAKYVDVLLGVFGDGAFPIEFVARGDESRGACCCAACGQVRN